jgi:hypothetical protein
LAPGRVAEAEDIYWQAINPNWAKIIDQWSNSLHYIALLFIYLTMKKEDKNEKITGPRDTKLNKTLQLFPPPKIPGPRMPTDYFFRSLVEE